MLASNPPNLRSFVSNAHAIIPIILYHQNYHISDYSQQQIAINKSLSIAQPLIIPIEKANKNYVSLEDFLVLLDERLLKEANYAEEIIKMKNDCWEEYNELCKIVSDKEFATFIRHQRQKIIDYIFDSLKFEKQQIIAKFYDKMMNGFDDEAMKEFDKIICSTLWKPIIKPLPLELIAEMRNAFEEIKNKKCKKNVEEATSKMILLIKEHLENKQLKLSDFKNARDLKNIFMELKNTRKTCSIIIDTINKTKFSLVKKFKPSCIKDIAIDLNSSDFEKGVLVFLTTAQIYKHIQIPKRQKKYLRICQEYQNHLLNALKIRQVLIQKQQKQVCQISIV